jgi:hypothetical protein
MTRVRAAGAIAAAFASAVLLAGCTGIPSSSSPQTVQPLDAQSASGDAASPPPVGADPRTIVTDFLTANAVDPDKHTSARAFLTPAARNGWSDVTATIVSDESIGTYDAKAHTLLVQGRILGQLNADGIYTPSLQADGQGGPLVPFNFHLSQAGGQYRIDVPPRNGLLLSDAQFQASYRQRLLYFYDVADKYLVPDLRWSALTDRTQLSSWLLTRLVSPSAPRPELQNAVSTDTLPAQADVRNLTVRLGSPTKIEIPGSSSLAAAVRNRLAAQIANTLLEPLSGGEITVTDGGAPVDIPSVGGSQFTASDFDGATGPKPPDPAVYYLVNGQVRTEDGKAVSGPLDDGRYVLTSVALARPHAGGPLLVAGVQGSGNSARLLVGTPSGLRPTTVRGELSRPAFAPGLPEVWIGVGSGLYRVTTDGATSKAIAVPIPAVSGGGRVVAVRLSPDGSRIAIVVSGAKPSSKQLYVGTIVRGAGVVRVDTTLSPISPDGVVVTDVGWLDSLKLFAIGWLSPSGDARTFTTGVDGTEWTNIGIDNLPQPPDSLAVTAGGPYVWVSAFGFVWKAQTGTQWVSPGPTGETRGQEPVYLS